ncbi:4-alpha-glucanotransferase DPE2 [Dichanthelium oligosanthes]|uniref:4-alpha-glucanotransferase n=1 Tax=Dichanthelium oligosanthes TaxID=888268 RepID=A0A1E5UVW2_9POAL|nr:4-alpha-glucanotransferase DPE2 [Dichanthelium oligosanthes]
MASSGPTSGKKSLNTVTLLFKLPYYTQWGQSLLLAGSEPALGSWNVKQGLSLTPVHQDNELIWCGSVSVAAGCSCEYKYYVVDDNKNVLRWEAGEKRKLVLPEGVQEGDVIEIRDWWQDASEALFLRSAFKNVVFNDTEGVKKELQSVSLNKSLDPEDIVVQFVISCPRLVSGSTVVITGSNPQLGRWRAQDGLKLSYVGDSLWKANCVLRKSEFPDAPWRGAGVAVPVFSIRSDEDLGVGEFLDLKLLVDWAVNSGFHLVQLLPINDTSVHGMWWDSYPYSSLSVFALHPLYLRVQALSDAIPADVKDVDYEATLSTKLSIAKKIFNLEKDKVLNSSSFKQFLSENEEWLKPYAAFCFLRDFFETSDHSQWGRFSQFSKEKLEKLISEGTLHHDVIRFHYYVQYHLYMQLSDAAAYARKKKVILKGDLPIGVDRNSVDTWVYPTLFRMNTATGAPPDYFDKNGQNWGFPTYNWEEMSKDNYGWWRGRLTQMAKYFTAYRIDHILGFFRIWELPDHAATGLVGKFRPSIPLSQEELLSEGLWDYNRMSQPYIRQDILEEKFGSFWTVIAANFLNEYQKQCYEFKDDCNTEKKIIAKIKTSPEKSLWIEKEDSIRRGLFDLLQNIVLIRDPEDPTKFYPRFNLEDTSSYRDLDEHGKNVLRRLYYDYYFARQENLWRQNALKTLPVLLNSSDMLACGEDLGLIPACVHPVMQELGLIGLRIQRMPSEPNMEFGIPSQYSYMTVCAPSCHDCSTLRAWWEEDEGRRSRFYKTVVGSDQEPPSRCTPEVVHFVVQQHFDAPSMWAIFPLQDLLALKDKYTTRPAPEETINDPTNPKHYWRFRVHVTLESLLDDKDIQATIKDLVTSSGRSFPGKVAEGADVSGEKLSKVQLNGKA